TRPPLRSPPFPYTTLFRSEVDVLGVRTNRVNVGALGQAVCVAQAVCLLFVVLCANRSSVRCATWISHRPRCHQLTVTDRRSSARSEEHTSELQSRENLVCR